jgi:anti-sigma28 factor (negative regulator of flagellin synthesis)
MNRSDGIGTTQWCVDPTGAAARASLSGAGQTEMKSPPTRAKSASGSASQADKVDLSTKIGAMARALTSTDVRVERIAAVRQSIAASSYNVPSSDIAGKLINSLLKERP